MRRAKGGKGIKSLDAALRTVRSNLGKHLNLPVREFGKSDLRSIRDDIHKRAPQQASRFLSYCGPIWRWFAQEDIVDYNFSPDVIKVASINKRERILDHQEIAAIWHATFKLDKGNGARSFAKLVRFLLVTAQRRGEAAALRHGSIFGRHLATKAGGQQAGS